MVLLLRYFGQSQGLAARTSAALIEAGALTTALNWYRAMFLAHPRAARVKVATPTLFVWCDGDIAVGRKTSERCAKWVTGPFRFEILAGVSHWMLGDTPDDVVHLLLEQFVTYPRLT